MHLVNNFLQIYVFNLCFQQVIDGNMIIKMAVKDTPTLLGNKLKQYYFKVKLITERLRQVLLLILSVSYRVITTLNWTWM